MTDIANEPAALMAATLSRIIGEIKEGRPTKTDGSGLTTGFVFSQMPIGQMVDPRDFTGVWTPIGGTPPGAPTGKPPVPPAPGGDPAAKQAQENAYNTCTLVDTMIMPTGDGSYKGWPQDRKLSVAYGELLQAMEAPAPPPRSASEQAAIDGANKVLYNTDPNGLFIITPRYKQYTLNAQAYQDAKVAYAKAEAQAMADPASADWWPQESASLQQKVDTAYDQWKTQGAPEVEAALATLESLGIPLEQGLIAKARKIYDQWQVGLAGVPSKIPYSMVMPSSWADPAIDDIGFTRIQVDQGQTRTHYENHGLTISTGEWSSNSSSSSGSGGIGIFGFGFTASHSEHKQEADGHTRSDTWDSSTFHNDSHGLSIDLEYGLCRIERPWLVSDLFYMRNYWVKQQRAKAISDGTLSGQIDRDPPSFLPTIPTHFLVIRNVTIKLTQGSTDYDTFEHLFSQSDDHSLFTANSTGGGIAGMFGPITFGGGGSHQESHFSASSTDTSGHDDRSDYGVTWDNGTLTIKGAQIVAWLSEVVPACAPLDDPDLPAPAAAGSAASGSQGAS